MILMHSRGNPSKSRQSSPVMAEATKDGSRWAAPIVLCVTFLVYSPTLWFDFVYDDLTDIVNNKGIQSWDAVPGFFLPGGGQLFGAMGWHADRFYRPLFMLWLRLNHALFALKPGGWHMAALAAHLLATLMVYLLVRRLLGEWKPAALA